MTRVLVTPRSMSVGDNSALERLRAAGLDVICPSPGRQPTEEELRRELPGTAVWIAGVEPIGRDLLAAATDLRAICRNGAGVDAIDHHAAQERGIDVIPARGANARGVAELALGLIIAGFRGLIPSASAVAAGRWERSVGRELAGATLGVVGYGAIGRILGALGRACDMHVVSHDPYLARTGSQADDGTELLELGALLDAADAVSLHLPALPDGPLIGAREVARMRTGAMLVNTARSGLVDAEAVLAALDAGRLRGYAVDAFDVEPPPVTALLRHPLVIASPHLGAATAESIERASLAAVDNTLAVLGLSESTRAATGQPNR